MSSYGFSWCRCPHCPSDESSRQTYSTRYLSSVPYYVGNHQHGICEWCEIWQKYVPGFELSPAYRLYAHTFEAIHAFFRGTSRTQRASTREFQEMARLIRGVAKYIDGQNEMEYRMYRLKQLVHELVELADDVYREAIHDIRMYERLPGTGGPLARRSRMLMYR